ncbi:MAG TPA: agmatine deiminase family protein [Xanthomonadaceae bacterium]|jgi:agmatine/peptidylarginine deiminase|nr:agmatine deiminase family protein [Xanthomonadaceae bacterium]
MTAPTLRFPAEWEPQSAVLLAWPHAGTDWAARLTEVEATYVALVAAITRFQTAVVCVADDALRRHASDMLAKAGVPDANLRFVQAAYDDTWLRDSGPLTLVPSADASKDSSCTLLDFKFNAWGEKYVSTSDDKLVAALFEQDLFPGARRERLEFTLEGGSIETDGEGTLLSTWQCLHKRHPGLGREQLSEKLCKFLRQKRVLWLDFGYLQGDDTDAHVDTLARFASSTSIVYQGCDDQLDCHFEELRAMAIELAGMRTAQDGPYRMFGLPWARPILENDRRLAASYANFLIVNGAVLMPTYDDPADARAAAVLAEAFPDREIVPVPCRPLIWQNGSLHCLTMQIPIGAL